MNSWDLNKVIGAVLGTALFVLVLKMIVIPILYYVAPEKPGYIVQGVPEATTAASTAPEQEAIPDWGTVLPKADVAKGQQIAQRCQQCHNWTKGGPNQIGPNLWGVVGRPRASLTNFSYSSAMTSNHDIWDYDRLFQFWKSPGSYVAGTKMSFAGLRSAQDRIDLLAYMRTQADNPLPIPAPAPPKAASTPAPATPSNGAAATPAKGTPAPASTPPKGAPATPATTAPKQG